MKIDFLKLLRSKNTERHSKWPGSEKVDLTFRALEFGEEAGEVLGAVKKYFRALNGVVGNTKTKEEIFDNLKDEIGDALITLDLICMDLNIDIGDVTSKKFNKTSKKVNIDVLFED